MASLVRFLLVIGYCAGVTTGVSAQKSREDYVPETPSPQEIEICLEMIDELMAEAQDMDREDVRIEQEEAESFCRSGAFFAAIDEAMGEESNDIDEQTSSDDDAPIDRPDWIR
ncbi:hypothetical protein [Paremcibacter congregatus]|uniref:hypothetical protein n=1 Tax=Paremcibacter congregatus TaxID=2043170 RepID=UPI003A93F9A0